MRNSTAELERLGQGGFASTAYVVAAAFALWFFAILANVIVMQYAAGVVRLAIDEGVRRGATVGAGVAECEQVVGYALADLLGGEYGSEIEISCVEAGGWIRATAKATLGGFVPPLPDVVVDFEASAAVEPAA